MLYLDIARILLGVVCIVAAAYWSAVAVNFSNRIARVSAKLLAFAIMIAGALQLSIVINTYV